MIEDTAREALAAALKEEAASRSRVEQAAIAVAERVGRELVQLAFSAVESKRGAEPAESAVEAVPIPPSREVAPRPSWSPPGALLPWLGGLTLAVLYLLVRTFL